MTPVKFTVTPLLEKGPHVNTFPDNKANSHINEIAIFHLKERKKFDPIEGDTREIRLIVYNVKISELLLASTRLYLFAITTV